MEVFFKIVARRSRARLGVGMRARPVGEATMGESTSLPVVAEADAGPKLGATSTGSGLRIASRTSGPIRALQNMSDINYQIFLHWIKTHRRLSGYLVGSKRQPLRSLTMDISYSGPQGLQELRRMLGPIQLVLPLAAASAMWYQVAHHLTRGI